MGEVYLRKKFDGYRTLMYVPAAVVGGLSMMCAHIITYKVYATHTHKCKSLMLITQTLHNRFYKLLCSYGWR